jgi:hypothetical protein
MMWTAGCLLLVAVLAAPGTRAFDPERAKEVVDDFRIHSQNLHADFLDHEIDKLEHEYETLSPRATKEEIARTKARINKLEGSGCGKKEFSCGGDWPECVNHLLFCDGIKDCHNGHDEDPEFCDGSVVHVGSTFRGVVDWKSCVEHTDHNSIITITATRRSPYFKNRTFLRATVTREYNDKTTTTYTAHGYFVYAARKLVVIADKDAPNQIATVCSFDFGNNDEADCEVVVTSSRSPCGVVRMNRV